MEVNLCPKEVLELEEKTEEEDLGLEGIVVVWVWGRAGERGSGHWGLMCVRQSRVWGTALYPTVGPSSPLVGRGKRSLRAIAQPAFPGKEPRPGGLSINPGSRSCAAAEGGIQKLGRSVVGLLPLQVVGDLGHDTADVALASGFQISKTVGDHHA